MSVSTPDLAAGEERLLQCLDEINRRVTASRWLPRRLILINWWLFGEQVFHFAQGRLVLHGRNASGKSTVLSAAVTLVLDGNKSPERIDTFGGRGRNVRYYLIGDADATPDSSFYFEGRTGYVALEFQHGASGRTLTIGVGLYTHRSRPGGEVDFWGFSIEDGRRIGEDLFLYDDQRLPLSWRALEERIGRGGRVVRSVAEYKRLVNALLFGFDDPADYDDLLTLLLELRSPKLNKDLRPSDVCEVLRTALAPLEEGLLDQVSVTIEAIDECLDRIAETDEQVRAVQAIDDAAAAYLNQEAQLVAVSLRAAMAARARAQALYTRLEQGLSRERTRLDAYSHLLARVQQVLGEVDAELRALEAHQAFRAESDLEAARQELDEAQRRLNETRAELEKAVQAVDRFAQRADAARRDWQRQRAALSEHLAETAGHARAAAWAAAQEVIAGLARAVEALGLPDARLGEALGLPGDGRSGASEEGIAGRTGAAPDATAARPGAGTYPDVPDLTAEGRSRVEALRQVLEERRGVARAEAACDKARAVLDEARIAFRKATDALNAASDRLQAVKDGAAEGLYRWREEAQRAEPPDHVLAAAIRRIHAYPDGDAAIDELREPLLDWLEQEGSAIDEQIDRLRGERTEPARRIDELEAEIERLRSQRDLAPERARATEHARARLREAGIPAYPLYAVCDFAEGLTVSEQAAIEAALAQAGLLDALIVPRARVDEVRSLLAAPELADRWIEAEPLILGHTLADRLRPALPPGVEGLSAADVAAALRSVAWGQPPALPPGGLAVIEPSGEWRLGILAGSAERPEGVEPRYIGEANRRAYRQRRLEELAQELAAARTELERIDRALEKQLAERKALSEDRRRLERLPLWRELLRAVEERSAAEDARRQAEARLAEAIRAEEAARTMLDEARRGYRRALERVPEAQGRDEEGLYAMLQGTEAVLRELRRTGGELQTLARLERDIAQLDEERHLALERKERLLRRQRDDEAEVARRAATCRALEQTLRELGIEELRARIRWLARRRRRLERADRRLSSTQARLDERVRQGEEKLREAAAALEAARADEHGRRASLRQRLLTHPSLADALERFDEGPEGPARAVEHLLRFRRRSEEPELLRNITDDRDQAFRHLSGVFERERATLAAYAPELDAATGLVGFRDQGRTLAPHELVRQLDERRRFERLLLEQRERELYEDVILRRLAAEIRRKIARAERWVDEVNRLLEERALHGGEVLSLQWRPRVRDRSGSSSGNLQRLVELIRRDVETLTREELDELIGHFRDNVNRIREQERAAVLPERFRTALEQVLDYREWFDFVLRTRRPGEPVRELTDHRFASRSGAEKSLAVFVPLLAAAHARYQAARPDAPRLVGLDEAFAGVDERNTQVMFRLMVELDFSWIMTSEKLRGEGAALPACATYHMVPGDGLVVPVLSVWDGERRLDALETVAVEPQVQRAAGDGDGRV